MKKCLKLRTFYIHYVNKLPLVYSVAMLLLLFGTLHANASNLAEGSKFDLSFKDATVEEFFAAIESQSDYRFLYRHETIENKRITINAHNAGIDEVLQKALLNVDIDYTILANNLVVIKPSETKSERQGITIKGQVISSTDNKPMPGVSVLEKGTQNGTITNIDGAYTITVSGNDAVLTFSFMGYDSQEIAVGDQTVINLTLSEEVTELDQVVVVGYGQMKKSDLTGAVVSVNEESLRSSVSTNIDQALQGRVAGVQITTNSGQPGGATSVRIRGASSINNSNEPLYVIDGVQFQGTGTSVVGFDWAGGANGQNRVNPLSTINPNDIVNIEILKDASASAIYGSQAANGVVIITTKHGQKGNAKVSYNTYYALQTLPKKLEMMDLPQFADYRVQIAEETGQQPDDRYLDPTLLGSGTDWQSAIFRPAWTASHYLSVSGGSEKMTYAITGGYFSQDGIIIGSNLNRYTGRVTLDNQVKDWIKVGTNIAYTRTNETITLNDGSDGVIMNALTMPPDVPVRDFDGNYAGPSIAYSGSANNPVALALIKNNTLSRERLMGNTYGSFDLFKGMNFRSELAIDNNNSINIAFIPSYQFGAIKNDVNKMRQRDENTFFWSWNNILTYNKILAEKHNLTAMLASEDQKSAWQGTVVTKEDFATNDIHVLSEGDDATSSTDGWKDGTTKLSYFGRVNYNYDERYLTTVTVRADGSSKFGPDHKWGYFPSGSFAWRISNEGFMKNVTFIREMKLRLGYGLVGNMPDQTYLYGSSLRSDPTPFGTYYKFEKNTNPKLKWESTTMYNIGLDLTVLSGRISLVADVYKKITDDMLFQLSIPEYLGGPDTRWDIAAPYINAGKLENKGIEFTLTTHNIKSSKFTWQTDITFTLNRNKIVEMADTIPIFDGLYWYSGFQTATMTTAGQPIGVYYGYITEGIFQNEQDILNHAVQVVNPDSISAERPNGVNLVNKTTGVWIGDIKFKDVNGDGKIDEDDQTIIGNPNPKFSFGFNNTFAYGPFDLSIYLQGSYGGDILNYSRVVIENMMSPYSNQAATVANRSQDALIDPEGSADDPSNITLANPGTNMPRFATNDVNQNNRMSDRFIEDGSYLRIQNLTFAYTLPPSLTQKVKIDRLRLYINCQNLYTFTKYSGYDPEIGAFNQNARVQNVDMGRYPTPRMVTFGLDVDF
jgi:TonB-linked SusC/RagA family outer membrane protein